MNNLELIFRHNKIQNSIESRPSFVTGPDWAVTAGLSDGLSQSARRREGALDHRVVWNFPIDVTFRSTSPFGWPQVGAKLSPRLRGSES